MKHFLFAPAIFLSLSIHAQVWTQRADFPDSPRSSACGFSIGTAGYIGMGYDSTSFRRNFFLYLQSNNTWQQAQSLGGINGSGLSRNMAAAFSINTKGYVVGGQGSNPYLSDTWEYDSGTNIWTQKATFAGTARRGAVGFAIGTKGYVACGKDLNGFKNDVWEYNQGTNTWTAKNSFPGSPRQLAVAFVIGTKGYVGCGDDGVLKNDFYEFDPIANTWAAKTPFAGTPRSGAVGFGIGTKGYVGTGYDNTLQNTNDFWEYDPIGNTWAAKPNFGGMARTSAVGFAIGSIGYIGTGYSTTTLKDFWQYGPPLGVEELGALNRNVKIFPNPLVSTSIVRMQDKWFENGEGEFRMLDANGNLVRDITALSGKEFSVSRGDLPSGNYFFQVFSGKELIGTGKITVL